MKSVVNRPKSAVKLIYTIDSKKERILLKKENEEISNKHNFQKIQFKNENLFEIFEKQKNKVNQIELYNKKEGTFIYQQKILIGIYF